MRILVLFLLLMIALSLAPKSEVYSKQWYGGHYDLDIAVGRSHTDVFAFDRTYVTKENFDLILQDLGKLPMLFNETVFPQVKEQFVKHKEKLFNNYVAFIEVHYSLKHSMIEIAISGHPNYVRIVNITLESEEIPKISVLDHGSILIAVYANLTQPIETQAGDIQYQIVLDPILDENFLRTQVLSLQAQETLKNHKDELFANAVDNEKVPIERIGMRMLDDLARVTVIFPFDDKGEVVKPIDETKTGVQMIPEFPIGIFVISAAVAVMLYASRFGREHFRFTKK